MFGNLSHPHVSMSIIHNSKNVKEIQMNFIEFIECQKGNMKYIHTLGDYLSVLKHNKTFSHSNMNKPLRYCAY